MQINDELPNYMIRTIDIFAAPRHVVKSFAHARSKI